MKEPETIGKKSKLEDKINCCSSSVNNTEAQSTIARSFFLK
jgi:hypothetical protein